MVEVSIFGHVYFTLMCSSLVCLFYGIGKLDWETVPAFLVATVMFGIGFSFNYWVCEFSKICI